VTHLTSLYNSVLITQCFHSFVHVNLKLINYVPPKSGAISTRQHGVAPQNWVFSNYSTSHHWWSATIFSSSVGFTYLYELQNSVWFILNTSSSTSKRTVINYFWQAFQNPKTPHFVYIAISNDPYNKPLCS